MIVKKTNACDTMNSVVIKMKLLGQFLNFFLYLFIYFFTKRLCKHEKAPKAQKHKIHKNATRQKQKAQISEEKF